MRRGIQISLMVFGVVVASGGVLTVSSNCSAGGMVGIATATGCRATSNNDSAGFGETVTTGVGFFSGDIGATATANDAGTGSAAQGSLSYSEALYTLGPVRPGFMFFSTGGGGASGEMGGGNGTAVLGPWGGFAVVANLTGICQGLCGANLVPVELGTEFNILITMSANVSAAGIFNNEDVGLSLNAEVLFLEADGLTSVPLFDASVPEPSGGLLCVVGLGLIGVIRRIRG